MDAYIGEIRPFAFGWAPEGWLLCNGSTLQIVQYQALAAILGNIYGTLTSSTFVLPNLLGNAIMGAGIGIGLTPRPEGSNGGTSGVTITGNTMPYHNHTFNGAIGGGPARKSMPTDNTFYLTNFAVLPATGSVTLVSGYVQNPPTPPDTILNPNSVGYAGGSSGVTASHENRQPFLTVAYYINYNGIWPEHP
jgi:microcystin-dependent protein